jgi:hypothetical protein
VTHRGWAAATIAAAVTLDILLGLAFAWVTPGLPWWHGLYCSLANAVTVGGDVPPANRAGYAITAVECLTVVPLFAASISLFTSYLASTHVQAAEDRMTAHVTAEATRVRGHVEQVVAQAMPDTGAAAEPGRRGRPRGGR